MPLINSARFLCKSRCQIHHPHRQLHFARVSILKERGKISSANPLVIVIDNCRKKSNSSEKFEDHFAIPGFVATVMGKRKEVGNHGSSKKKKGVSHKRSEDVQLKERRKKIKKIVVNKGKRPVMRFDTSSESSDSGVRVVRKKRKKTRKEAHYPEVEYEMENQTESDNNSEDEDSARNPLINDVLEAPTSDYSSDSGEQGKQKRLLPRNCFGKLQIEKGVTYYRSNLRAATSSLHELTFSASHLKALRRIPSWYMFEAIHKHGGERMMSRCEKSEEVIRNILLSYDQESDHFILGGKELQLTGRDVALIFAIVCGTRKIPFKKPNSRNAKWVKHNFGKDTESSLNKTLIFNRMASILDRTDETSVEDVARLMHCYLMASVLTPGQSSAVSWYLTDYLEDLEGAMTYDWCGYIAAILQNGIRNTRNLKIGGCAMLLPYWLCEHTSLVEPSRKVLFPRFMKWDLQKLLKRIFRVHLSYIDSPYVTKDFYQDISDGGENIHLTADLGADSNDTQPKPGAMSFDHVHGDIASSSRTPFKAFGGNVVEGDSVQRSSLKNGRSVIREEAIREDEVLEIAFGETLIPETGKCEKPYVATGVKDKEPIISSCPSFSLDITQLRSPKKDQPTNDHELKLKKEREKAAFEERLKAFEEQTKRICELNEARFRALEEQNRRLVIDNETLRANFMDTANTTHTQIYSDPKNLDKIDELANIHLAKITTEAKKTKLNSPNSMTKCIKSRTVIGDRKPKDITPTRGERDLKRIAEIPYVPVEEFDDELNVERVNENPFKGLDERYHAVRKASGHLRSVIAGHCSNGLERIGAIG
ncbi:hypothetical protein OROMI_021888 [Orobanche minor]